MYTIDDIIEYLQKITPAIRTRERNWLDPRNYLIAILYYRFNQSEIALETLLKIDRSTVNHAKRMPQTMIKYSDPTFMRNTMEVRKLFPHDFMSKEPEPHHPPKYSYRVSFDKKSFKKVQHYCAMKGEHPSLALSKLILKSLDLWEK
jgi:hypothetical protein